MSRQPATREKPATVTHAARDPSPLSGHRQAAETAMRLLITGGTGVLGRAFAPLARAKDT